MMWNTIVKVTYLFQSWILKFCFFLLQVEKLRAEQSKLPPTPLLGRKVFLDPQDASPSQVVLPRLPISPVTRQTIYEQNEASSPPSPSPATPTPSPSSVARRLGSTVANYTPVMNGSSYRHTLEARHGGVVGVAAGLGVPSPSSIASVATAAMLVSANQARESTSVMKDQAVKTMSHLQPVQAAKALEAKSSPYLRQPKIKHLDDAVTPLLVASRLEKARERGREREIMMGEIGTEKAEVAVMAEVVLQEPRERLHSEPTRGPRGSRTDPLGHAEPQVQTHTHHRIERQLSSEQLIQARRDELPQEVWREHAERRDRRTLERQTSSEQEGHGSHEGRRRERDRHRLERQESSEHDTGKEHSDRRSAGGWDFKCTYLLFRFCCLSNHNHFISYLSSRCIGHLSLISRQQQDIQQINRCLVKEIFFDTLEILLMHISA